MRWEKNSSYSLTAQKKKHQISEIVLMKKNADQCREAKLFLFLFPALIAKNKKKTVSKPRYDTKCETTRGKKLWRE